MVHPKWQENCQSIVAHILGDAKEDFLIHSMLFNTMIRGDSFRKISGEENFLLNEISEPTKRIIEKYIDVAVGGVELMVGRVFKYTANSLAQLFHFAKLIELNNREIKTIVEFGGGYGNLARIAKVCVPDITYILIDLPEISAIQSLYLNVSLPGCTKVHYKAPLNFEPGFIHLVPVYLVKDIDIADSDVFVSTFAISESTSFVQEIIINKNFFHSNMSFIVGLVQNAGWCDINPLINSIKTGYSRFDVGQYNTNAHIYEIWGLK